MDYQRIIEEAQQVQRRNHASSAAWKQAHETIKDAVQQQNGVDIDGEASWKH